MVCQSRVFPIDSIDVNLVDYPFQKTTPSTTSSTEEPPSSSLNGSENGHQTKTPPSVYTPQSTVHISRHTTDPKIN